MTPRGGFRGVYTEYSAAPWPGSQSAAPASRTIATMVTMNEIAALARTLPRSEEAVVRGRLKYRVRSIVWLAFSADGETMGFAFPKEMREALVGTYPHKFHLPRPSDMRFNWVGANLAALDDDEWRDLVLEAWRMVVPKRVAAEYFATVAAP